MSPDAVSTQALPPDVAETDFARAIDDFTGALGAQATPRAVRQATS